MAVYTDNFDRANGGLGANWTTITGNDAPQILTNKVYSANAAGRAAAYWSANQLGTDHYSQVELRGVTYEGVGSACRVQTAADTFYFAWYDPAVPQIQLRRRIAGVNTTIGTYNVTCSIGDTIKLSAEGVGATVTLKVYRNGGLVINYGDTDAARIVTSGYVGIRAYQSGGGTYGILDNWEGGDVAAGGGYSNTYYASTVAGPSRPVNAVNENGVALTERASIALTDANAASWYWDRTNARVYVHPTGSVSPYTKTVQVMLMFCFSIRAEVLDGRYYDGRVSELPTITSRVETKFGDPAKLGGGDISFQNEDGFFDSLASLDWNAGTCTIKMGADDPLWT